MKHLLQKLFGRDKNKQDIPHIETVVDNPLYQASENEGFNPLYSGSDGPLITPDEYMASQSSESEEASEHLPAEEIEEPLEDTKGDEIKQLRDELLHSEKGGLGSTNSEKYQGVMNSMDSIIDRMGQGFTADMENNRSMLVGMFGDFVSLIDACDIYLGRTALTGKGKARQAIVQNIKALSEKDMVGVRAQIDHMQFLSPEQQSSLTWEQIISEARTARITINGNYDDLKFVGGQASKVAVIKQENLAEGRGGFFKLEENYELDDQYSIKNRDAALATVPLSPEDEAVIKTINNTVDLDPKKFGDRTEQVTKFKEVWRTLNKAYDTKKEVLCDMERMRVDLSGGKQINLSRRNVAMSRIADLLGVGNVIAHSDTAEVTDATGTKRKGNIMQAAQGRQADDVVSEANEGEIRQLIEEGQDYNKFDQSARFQNVFSSGSLQKSMSSLQVLDELFGQVDRHQGNFFLQMDNGVPVGVQGIDNDFSFGYNGLSDIETLESKNREVVRDGQIWIPHMDKALAQRILDLSPSVARYALADLIEKEAIDAFIGRLQTMQTAIKAEMEKPNSNVFVENDNDWNQNTMQDFLEKSTQKMLDAGTNKATLASSYYSDLLDGGWKATGAVKTEMQKQMAEVKYNELLASGALDTIEKTIRFALQNQTSSTEAELKKAVEEGRLLPNMGGSRGQGLLSSILINLGQKEFNAYVKLKQEQKAQREKQQQEQQTSPVVG